MVDKVRVQGKQSIRLVDLVDSDIDFVRILSGKEEYNESGLRRREGEREREI